VSVARVGVLGASGYMGGEALRVLLEHPDVELAWASSRSEAPIERFHPNLAGSGVETIHPDRALPCDVVFVSLPTAPSLDTVARFVEAGSRVIDLGSGFRLRDRATWERTYGMTHPHWALAEEAVYGIPELHAEAIVHARLVANPGCFSSAAILALAPLVREGLIDPAHVVVDGLSGTAGAGADPDRAIHHPEIGDNLVPYNLTGHRHSFEMEQELGALAGEPLPVHFTPIYVPIVRGILDVCSVFPRRALAREAALELYRDFYSAAPFVHVWDQPREPGAAWQYRPYPWVRAVAGTNRCQLGLEVDPERGRLVVLAALDSLGKGGAQVGIENMNLMLGLPRERGLERYGLHP
jgi:N-acetyl-gamma-glutamyl-phosphate reductase common form